MMAYSIERHDDLKAAVFHVEGDIDIAIVPELRSAIEGLLEGGVLNVIVDLHGVTYADSSALGLLVWLDGRLRDSEGKIVLSGANRDVSRILEISGLVTVARSLSSSETVGEALGGLEAFRRDPRHLWCEELTMPADVEELASVRENVTSLIVPLHFSEASLFDIKVALGEALANAVRHGSSAESNQIGITVDAYDDRVVLRVRDSGCGFDGEHSCSDDLYASGGRGIMFMKALMDRVEFEPVEDGGTIVTLVKHRTTAEPD